MQLLASGAVLLLPNAHKKGEDGPALDLSGVSPHSLVLCLYGARMAALRSGFGQWSIDDVQAAYVTYSPAHEDVSIPGDYLFKVRMEQRGAPFYSSFVAFRIEG